MFSQELAGINIYSYICGPIQVRAFSIVMYAAAGFLTTVHFLNRKEGYHPVAVALRNTFFWLRHGLVEEIPSLGLRSWEHGLWLWHITVLR